MSLIVEDGTGLTNSESYASTAAADTRLGNRDQNLWLTLTQEQKEAALRRATDYMEEVYRLRWAGFRRFKTQALSWPRWDIWVDEFPVDPTSVPVPVQNACIDLALKAAAGDLAPDLTQNVAQKTVGPVAIQYDIRSPQYKRYRSIDMMLAPYTNGGTTNSTLVRG